MVLGGTSYLRMKVIEKMAGFDMREREKGSRLLMKMEAVLAGLSKRMIFALWGA